MKSLLVIPFLFSVLLFGQTYQYDVLLVGSDVGDMSLTRNVSGTKKTYKLETYTDVNYIVGRRKDHYTCVMEFDNNILISSKVENKKNDKLIAFTYVTKVDEMGYKVQTEKGLSTISGMIYQCCYDIFYKEPKGGENLFVERYGKFGSLTKTNDHVFKIEVKGVEDYTYNYENGKMIRMEVPSPLGKVKMVMK